MKINKKLVSQLILAFLIQGNIHVNAQVNTVSADIDLSMELVLPKERNY